MEETSDSAMEVLFVLPADVIIVPVADLSESLRKQIPHADGDFAISRPRVRRPSQIVDADTARLLAEFRKPSRIADAVVRYSRSGGLDPFVTLEASFDALDGFTSGRLLVPWDSNLADAVTASFVPGQKVAGFEIIRLVQALDDTELYQAMDGFSSKPVALKITRPGPTDHLLNMLAREVAVLRHLAGAGVPRLVSDGQWENRRFLACEWQAGEPVSAVAPKLRNAASGRIQLHRLCCNVGEAFARLHELQVVHGDVHPGNILSDDSICLLDFGLSRLLLPGNPFASAPRSGVAFYYSPELARALLGGELPPEADFASEQYALAVLLYQLLTGYYPNDFTLTAEDLLQQIVSSAALPFSRRGVEPWPAVESVLAVALSKDPESRFPSVREFMKAFAEASPPSNTPVRGSRNSAQTMLDNVGWDSDWFKRGVSKAPKASFCHGAAGIAYFVYRLALIRNDPALLALADAWAMRADPTDPAAIHCDDLHLNDSTVGSESPYHAVPGLEWIRALVAHARSDASSTAMATNRFLAGVKTPGPRMDLFLGAPGAALAANRLQRVTGEPRLQEYSSQFLERCCRGEMPGFRGMAHGTEGVLCAALRACQSAGAPAPQWLDKELERLAALPLPVDAGWCRGASGLAMLWTAAFEVSNLNVHLSHAEQAAWSAWNDASRNPSLCCGLGGEGFALLRLYQTTSESVWLERARQIANQAAAQTTSNDPRPWSLFKGRLGGALLEAELEAPELAELPLIG